MEASRFIQCMVSRLKVTYDELLLSFTFNFNLRRYTKGAFLTIDRPYGAVFDFLHHRIGSTHVAHHVAGSSRSFPPRAWMPFNSSSEASNACQ